MAIEHRVCTFSIPRTEKNISILRLTAFHICSTPVMSGMSLAYVLSHSRETRTKHEKRVNSKPYTAHIYLTVIYQNIKYFLISRIMKYYKVLCLDEWQDGWKCELVSEMQSSLAHIVRTSSIMIHMKRYRLYDKLLRYGLPSSH
jgi:hypothetical protein